MNTENDRLAESYSTSTTKSRVRLSLLSSHYGVHWTLVGILLSTVLSFAFGWLFFKFTEQRRQLAYTSSTPMIKVFDSKSASQSIRVFDPTDERIDKDVYVAEITLWNAGNVPIEPQDVRGTFKVRWPDVQDVISIVIAEETRPDTSRFQVTQFKRGTEGWEVTLQWDHFDPDSAIKLNFLFEGWDGMPTNLRTIVDGYIVNTPFVPVDRYNNTDKTTIVVSPAGTALLVGLIMGLASLSELFLERRLSKTKPQRFIPRAMLALLLVFGLYIELSYLWNLIFPPLQPPF